MWKAFTVQPLAISRIHNTYTMNSWLYCMRFKFWLVERVWLKEIVEFLHMTNNIAKYIDI